MRHTPSSIALIAAGLALTSTANAADRNFKNSLSSLPQNISIDVELSEDLAWRANNNHRNLSIRSGSSHPRNGFAAEGFYGEKDLASLSERLELATAEALTKQGVTVSDNSATTLKLTLVDARPTRPTLKQLTQFPALSQKSIKIGGVKIKGELISSTGEQLGEVDFKYFASHLDRFSLAQTTWGDANRGIRRFAYKVAKIKS